MATNMTAYDAAFTAKHHPIPTVGISTAASDGPRIKPICTSMLLVAMALGSSLSPTVSFISAWRNGWSNALPTPCTIANRHRDHSDA
ncbi:unannotated protein [freshwater metagenome]|uniref:Unannotated protein n=1 Tax=freshwater metagenome TaxID=449393 RepID=A0A6J7QPD2_9ZZZZ